MRALQLDPSSRFDSASMRRKSSRTCPRRKRLPRGPDDARSVSRASSAPPMKPRPRRPRGCRRDGARGDAGTGRIGTGAPRRAVADEPIETKRPAPVYERPERACARPTACGTWRPPCGPPSRRRRPDRRSYTYTPPGPRRRITDVRRGASNQARGDVRGTTDRSSTSTSRTHRHAAGADAGDAGVPAGGSRGGTRGRRDDADGAGDGRVAAARVERHPPSRAEARGAATPRSRGRDR